MEMMVGAMMMPVMMAGGGGGGGGGSSSSSSGDYDDNDDDEEDGWKKVTYLNMLQVHINTVPPLLRDSSSRCHEQRLRSFVARGA
jgi:hypothetical protein